MEFKLNNKKIYVIIKMTIVFNLTFMLKFVDLDIWLQEKILLFSNNRKLQNISWVWDKLNQLIWDNSEDKISNTLLFEQTIIFNEINFSKDLSKKNFNKEILNKLNLENNMLLDFVEIFSFEKFNKKEFLICRFIQENT